MTDSDLPKPLWKSPLFLVSMAVCLLIFLSGAYIILFWSPPLVISPATTRVTGPLTANGDIDFFKALEQRFYPPELTTDDNGFRDFIRLFGDASDSAKGSAPEFYRLQRYEKLGLDPKVPPTMTLPLGPYVFCKTKGKEMPVDFVSRPWTLDDHPILEEWLKDIDVPMDAVAAAIRKPVFFAPFLQSRESVESGIPQNLVTLELPDMSMFREITRVFHARAMYRIAQGNIDGAIDDKLIIYRLSRHVPKGGLLVQYLVGIALEGMAATIPVAANPEHTLTEQQIRRLLEGLDALPPRVPINNAFESERYMGLSCVQDISRDIPTCTTAFNCRLPVVKYTCNWNIVYRRMNEMYDAAQEPSPQTKYGLLIDRISGPKTVFEKIKFYGRMISPNGRAHRVADALTGIFCPATGVAEEAVRRVECANNLQRLSLAVLLYQCETGKLPDENWAAQIEKYLGENPKQYFSCPTNPSPEGQTTYAMVLRADTADTVGGSLDSQMFVELTTPVPLEKAVVSADDVLNRRGTGSKHPGGMNAANHNASVRFLAEIIVRSK